MPLYFDENRYPGVNVHLMNFLLQPDGGWESFHSEFVIRLRETFDSALPRNYYAVAEKSLQISELTEDRLQRTRPDVSIYQTGEAPIATREAVLSGTAPSTVLSLAEIAEEMIDTITAVGIYEVVGGKAPGRLVTRVEVLSPANKPPADYATKYLLRRVETFEAGVNLVEIDLIHTHRPVSIRVPSYPDRHEGATPTVVLVSDPHPSLDEGKFYIYHVPVSHPLPKVTIPLSGDEVFVADLQAVYNRTIAATRVFPMLVDYSVDPVNLEAYTESDRAWISEFLTSLRQEAIS